MEKIQSITIIAKRWFSESYRNTYFSAVVLVNGKERVKLSADYGYGRQCIHKTLLELAKLIPELNYKYIIDYCRENDIAYYESITDVARKKDL
jgi:hypothetical protein